MRIDDDRQKAACFDDLLAACEEAVLVLAPTFHYSDSLGDYKECPACGAVERFLEQPDRSHQSMGPMKHEADCTTFKLADAIARAKGEPAK